MCELRWMLSRHCSREKVFAGNLNLLTEKRGIWYLDFYFLILWWRTKQINLVASGWWARPVNQWFLTKVCFSLLLHSWFVCFLLSLWVLSTVLLVLRQNFGKIEKKRYVLRFIVKKLMKLFLIVCPRFWKRDMILVHIQWASNVFAQSSEPSQTRKGKRMLTFCSSDPRLAYSLGWRCDRK